MREKFTIISPQPYEKVDPIFRVSGLVPVSWLKEGYGLSNSIFLDLIDINGSTFAGLSIHINPSVEFLSNDNKRIKFETTISIGRCGSQFIIKSQGMITLRFSGRKEEQDYFLPVNIKGKNPNFIPDPELVIKHEKIGETVLRHKKEIKEYHKEYSEIWKKRREKASIKEYNEKDYVYMQDGGLIWGIFQIIEESENISDYNPFAEEDLEIKKLEEKYKEAIEAAGPFCGADILGYCGFHFIIYGNDHGRHLHVIHKGKGLNVRINFPELEIDSYKSGALRSKDEQKIISFLREPDNFSKVEQEFLRRDGVNS